MSAMPVTTVRTGARRAPSRRESARRPGPVSSSARRTAWASLLCASGVALAAVATAEAAPAPSPEALERAKAASDRGRSAHERGQYDRAVDAYQEAYVLAPSPGILFNLAQAYRLKGDCDNAVLMYRGYLSTRPVLQLRQVAEAHLATVEQCASSAVMGERPAPGGWLADSSAKGSSEAHPGRALRRGGIATAIGGGLLLGLGGYFAYRASDMNDQVEERYRRGAPWHELRDLNDRGDRYDSLAVGLAIAGGAAAVTGGALYMVGWRQAERARQPMVSVSPSKGGAAVRVAWDF